MRFFKRIFGSNSLSQSTSGISTHVSRLGRLQQICESTPRIERPISYRPESQGEQFAGRGRFGACKQFYSAEYDKEARSFIKKEITEPDQQGNENPEILAKIAQLNHPNIVQYVQLGKKGSPIIMRDAGQTLFKLKHQPTSRKRLKNQLRFYEELYIYLQLLNGVQALHHSKIHHRDLHDGNIAIQKDGTVRIIDFGSAVDSEAFETDATIYLKKQKQYVDLYSDISILKYRLKFILDNHKKIKKSANIKEKEHYKILSEFAQSGHFDLSDLISKLEKMCDCFPKWGNEQAPAKTSFTDVAELQERFRPKSSSAAPKWRNKNIGFLKRARLFFHLGRS